MERKRSKTHPAARQPRPQRRIHEELPKKLTEPAACPDCGCSYREGRWTWQPAPADAYPTRCPACERIASDYPAGVVQLRGGFALSHREELMNLLHNVEEREKRDHPLKRILAVSDEADGFTVSVTDAKLAEAFGSALHRAFEGQLERPSTSGEQGRLVRIHWTRD